MNEVTQPVRGGGVLGSSLAVVAALAAVLVFAPLASAASDPLASGTTTIQLGKGFSKKLAKSGVKLLKAKPATVKGSAIALPVASGTIDPLTGGGTVTHSGGFKFKRGRKTAAVLELSLDTNAKSLTAKVGGKKMKLASVDGIGISRDGFGANLAISKLKLTSNAAKALSSKLGFLAKKARGKGKARGKASASKGPVVTPFRANAVIGGSLSDTEPATVSIVGAGIAKLVPKSEEIEPYKTAEVKPTAVEPASLSSEEIPAVLVPVSGGSLAPDGSSGLIQTAGAVGYGQEPEGGLQIVVGFGEYAIDFTSRTVTADVVVDSNDQEKAPTPGKLGRRVVADLDMSGAVFKSDPAARTITVEGVRTAMRGDLAELMNTTYKKDAFKAGDTLGTFSFVAQAQ